MSYNVTKIHIYKIPGCGCKTFICFMLSIDIATRTKSDAMAKIAASWEEVE